MERNDDPSGTGGYGNAGDLSGTAGYGSVGGAAGGSSAASSNIGNIGESTHAGTQDTATHSGFTDRARNIASGAGERLADVGSTVRDRAGAAKNTLADMLESGAGRLRGSQGAVSGEGALAVEANGGRAAAVNDRLASGMQSAANLLRDTDFDGLRVGVERQVRENPGRSLLIAVGVGYLLGKALRR